MVWDPFRGRAPRTIRFCTILVHCGAALIVVGCLGVLIVPTALTFVLGLIAAAGFLRIEKNVEIVPKYKIRRDRYDEGPFISAALAAALDAVDRGVLALHLSYSAAGYVEQLEQARTARDAFADALNQLDGQDAIVKSTEAWQYWHAEARSGQQDADSRCSSA